MEMDGAKIASGMRTCADAVAKIDGEASRIGTSVETSAV
jgi:deoxyribose-phosphate aldolase